MGEVDREETVIGIYLLCQRIIKKKENVLYFEVFDKFWSYFSLC